MNDITLTNDEAMKVLHALLVGRSLTTTNVYPNSHEAIRKAIELVKAKMPPDEIDLGNGFTVKNGHNLHYVFTAAANGHTWYIPFEKKIEAIKMIRFLSGVGLQEGKEITDRVEGKA
jgi:hypothetical protein